MNSATNLFSEYGVNIVTGHRFLGGYIGNETDTISFIESKTKEWTHNLDLLSEIAETQPQAAFIALTTKRMDIHTQSYW